MVTAIWEKYRRARFDFYAWRYSLSLPRKLLLALGWACVVGLLAQARFYLPGTPVPVTGQTFGVLLAGVLLGRWWGGISLAIYAALGTAGVPWFSGGSSGVPLGPAGLACGGYILGFIFAALFMGHFTDKYVRSRSFFTMLGLMLVANFVLIYPFGLAQLYYWLKFAEGQAIGFSTLLAMGFIPFVAGDVIKVAGVALIARAITPKEAYNGEVDRGKWASWRIP